MDPDVDALVREQHLVAAAELAGARGDAKRASELFERACEWRRAGEWAMRAGDATRAMPLAVMGQDDVTAESALTQVARDANNIGRVAMLLARRGDHAWCARLYEAAGRAGDAARSWEQAGEAVRAAQMLEEAHDVVGAARVLEAAIRRDPTRWDRHVALGALLLRYGKTEAAARALQRVPESAPERRVALTLLLPALRGLGLEQAEAVASFELTHLGGPTPLAEPTATGAEVKARLFGRYEIVREIASSASARVVECVDGVRGDHVAVKIFAAYDSRGAGRDALARFEREVKVLGALDHPNVVPLYDYVPEGPAIVLAWMSGGTLEKMVSERPLSPARAVEIGCAVLAALGEAHRHGVLHRDIKPANVLFDDAGVARVGDFGVAHLGDLSATATAGVIGTLAYMSPEQREGRPATIQSDVYGAGAILLEMLTSERPAPPEPPRTLPSATHRDLDARHDALVLSLIAPDAAARPHDAFAARRSLMSLMWPSVVEPAAPKPLRERAPSDRPPPSRVLTLPDGAAVDQWIGRRIERVPLTETALARARAFAQSASPALQTVLRVDRDAGEIWLDPARGAPAQTLGRAARDALAGALDTLHAAGTAHGAVEPRNVFVDDAGRITLRFTPDAPESASADADRAALAGFP